MLLINKDQRSKVGTPAFLLRLLTHIKLYYGPEFYHLSDDELSQRIAHCVEVAREHGFTYERTLTMFTANMLRINPRFYEQPTLARLVHDTSQPEEKRLEDAVVKATREDWDEAQVLCDPAAYWRPIDNAWNEEA